MAPNKLAVWFVLGATAFTFSNRAAAQSGPPVLGQRGFQPGQAYTVDQLETVSTVTGNVSYRIPLASLPPGPSGPGVSIGLIYNSQIWDVSPYYRSLPGGSQEIAENPIGSKSGGWHYSFSYSLDVLDKPFPSGLVCGDIFTRNTVLTKVSFPDGSEHVLTPVRSADLGTVTNDGYYNIDPRTFTYTGCSGGGNISGDLVFYTTDGSYARVVIKDDGNHSAEGWLQKQWTLYLPDGSSVTGAGASTTAFADRNGNVTTVQNTGGAGSGVGAIISDAHGGKLTVQNNDDLTDTVSLNFNNSVIYSYTVTWEMNSVDNTAICSPSGLVCPAGWNFLVVTDAAITAAGITMRPYTFGYSPSWGELDSVALPSGGSVSYTYRSGGSRDFTHSVANPLIAKVVHHTEGDPDDTWTYEYPSASTSKVTAPDGGVTMYYFKDPDILSEWSRGLVYKVVQPNGDFVERVWGRNKPWQAYNASSGNPYVEAELRTAAGQTAVTEYRYDRNGNFVQTSDYDWTPSSIQHDALGQVTTYAAGVMLRQTISSMHVNTPTATVYQGALAVNVNETVSDDGTEYWDASAPTILNLPDSSKINGGGNLAITEFYYDANGNLTSERRWDSTKGGYVSPLTRDTASVADRSYVPGGHGALQQITDPRGYLTVFDYSLSSCGANLYPNSVTTASGQPESRRTDYGYNCGFGVATTIMDYDNTIVQSIVLDGIGRQKDVTEASNTQLPRHTQIEYDDIQRNVTTTTDRDTDKKTQTIVHYDDQQRERMRQSTDDDNSLGGWIHVETRYQNTPVRLKLVSNPYRSYSDPTMGWTLTTMDQMGRVSRVDIFGGSQPPSPWGTNATSLGETQWSYGGNQTTTTEPDNGSGLQPSRTTQVDSLGRLSSATDGHGSASYTYDALGNLKTVVQGTQTRTFVYDSLSRLSSATNPESNTVSYTYDVNGNLHTRQDARGITTTFTYDGQNRLKTKEYNDVPQTPSVTMTWNTGTGCLKGYLCSVQAGSTTKTYAYDVLGRVTSGSQTTAGVPYLFSYSYDLQGNTESITYPSGHVVTYALSDAGRATSVGSYATVIKYAAHGMVSSLNMGNGVQETVSYDQRLRAQTIAAAKSGSLLSLTNSYALNGNVHTQQVTIGASTTYIQTFGYDSANRLTGASESGAWTQTYSFDPYGNRAVTASSFPEMLVAATSTSQYNSFTNRLAQASDGSALPSDAYDLAGDLTHHPMAGQFSYDAENRMVSATVGGTTTNYEYDGEGRRVVAGATVFVYGANGELLAEYGGAGGSGTRYLTVDALGSTRMVTNGSGAVTSRHDYAPFGEELPPSSNPSVRTTANGFIGQEALIRPVFTGQLRDGETGLDFFGARYFSGAQGRFTSPDPMLNSAKPGDHRLGTATLTRSIIL